MKKLALILIVVAGSAAATSALAQGAATKDMPMPSTAKGASHSASGTVKKVDPSKGTITLDHGPVASLKWPSMTMEFEVADKKMLDDVKSGSRVDVRFSEKAKGKYVITDIKR